MTTTNVRCCTCHRLIPKDVSLQDFGSALDEVSSLGVMSHAMKEALKSWDSYEPDATLEQVVQQADAMANAIRAAFTQADGGACGDCDPCIVGEASVPEPVKRLIAEKNSLLQRVGELEDAATARTDTAEARLRRALTTSLVETGERAIAKSYGQDPDDFAPRTEMCTANNRPVPWWKVYEEQAEAFANTLPMPDTVKLREVLREHWLSAVVCDHEKKTDRPVCSCSMWAGPERPSIGQAVEAWIDHVIEALSPPSGGDEAKESEPPHWREVEMMRLIDLLRSGEGDSVTILCDNPDPRNEAENNAVICNGFWTDFEDRRFQGVGLLDALSAAMIEYKRPREARESEGDSGSDEKSPEARETAPLGARQPGNAKAKQPGPSDTNPSAEAGLSVQQRKLDASVTPEQATINVAREREAMDEHRRYENMSTAERCRLQGNGFLNDYD